MSNDTTYEAVTDRIVAALDAGTVPWRMPWRASTNAPRNIDGWVYRGINPILCLLTSAEQGFTSPYWMTYKQAKDKGGHVRKGGARPHKCNGEPCERQHATAIFVWKRIVKHETGEDGEPITRTFGFYKHYRVFNLDQTEGVKLPRKVLEERLAASLPSEHEPIEAAEQIAAGFANGPQVRHAPGRAFYSPASDTVSIPSMDDYAADDTGEYYSTLFHELGHSTAHKSRLDRDTSGYAFSSHERGREELVAEFTAAFLCAESGIEQTIDNSAACIAGWRSKIKDDPRAVVVAASAAQRAADHILGRKAPHEQTQDAAKAAA